MKKKSGQMKNPIETWEEEEEFIFTTKNQEEKSNNGSFYYKLAEWLLITISQKIP